MTMLDGKTAVVYGAGGFVGGAITRAFAAAGATVFLAGRTLSKLEPVASDIRDDGGTADCSERDVLEQDDVQAHLEQVLDDEGKIDIVFNAVTFGDVQGASLAELELDQVAEPVATALRAHHIPIRAASPLMSRAGSGVLMTVTGYGPPSRGLGATGMAWSLIEAMYRQLACDLGPSGIRVVWLRTGGFVESILGASAYESVQIVSDGSSKPLPETVTDESLREDLEALEEGTMLGRLASLREAGSAAVYLASDSAKSITAAATNLTGGASPD